MLRGSLGIVVRRGGTMQAIQEQRVRNRRGLTLVELLVTISIMATVTSMLVIAYRSAATEANNIRSASTIQKISRVLRSRMQEYESETVQASQLKSVLGVPSLVALPSNLKSRRQDDETVNRLLQRTVLGLTRQMILQEMPDHPDDLKWSSKWVSNGLTPSDQLTHVRNYLSRFRSFDCGLNDSGTGQVFAGLEVTPRTYQLINRLTAIDPSNQNRVPWHSAKNGKPWDLNEEPWEARNANAELLYLIIEDSTLNGSSAIELFGKSEIGDTDEDGLNEFIDAYRNPISWIRWPTSNLNVAFQHPDLLDPNLSLEKISNEPIDNFRSDPGYAVYSGAKVFDSPGGFTQPLVISPGADRELGILIAHPSPVNSTFFGKDSYSCGDFLLVMPYSPSGFLFVDPWYPRTGASGLGSVDTTRTAYSLDDLTNFGLDGAGL